MPPTPRFCLRHEEEAEGPVSAVFRDVRRRMPFVPALFKALAFDPGALETAWLQARALYDDPRAAEAAGRVAALARPELSYRPSPKVRETVAPFLAEIPTMLLVVSSLGLSLDGELELNPPPPATLPAPGPLPETPVPEERGEHPLFDEVRAAYGTAHVPSVYRALAATGLLREPWHAIGPFLASTAGRTLADRVRTAAEEEAQGFPRSPSSARRAHARSSTSSAPPCRAASSSWRRPPRRPGADHLSLLCGPGGDRADPAAAASPRLARVRA